MTSRGRKFLRDMWRHFAAMSMVMALMALGIAWLEHARLASEADASRQEATCAQTTETSLDIARP